MSQAGVISNSGGGGGGNTVSAGLNINVIHSGNNYQVINTGVNQYTSSVIDFTQTGLTDFFTTSSTKSFMVNGVILVADTFGNTPNYDAIIAVGYTPPSYSDINGGLGYIGITQAEQYVILSGSIGGVLLVPPSTDMKVYVSVGESGSAFTGQVILTGVYL